jgi:hypothetical protein
MNLILFDVKLFMPIIRLFNGAIKTLPESHVTEEERPLQPKGFADHKVSFTLKILEGIHLNFLQTFSLDGVSVIFVELKRHLVDVEGLTQLLAEMLGTF